MFFEPQEEAYLKHINDNAIFRGIIKKISTFEKTPRYKTGIEDQIQVSDWKYRSGRLDERETLIGLLTLSKEKPNLEE